VPTRNTSPRKFDDVALAVARIASVADDVRCILGMGGMALTVVDLSGRQHRALLGARRWPECRLDLRGVRELLAELDWPAAEHVPHIIAAELARQLAPLVLADGDTPASVGMIVGYVLARVGAGIEAIVNEIEPALAAFD